MNMICPTPDAAAQTCVMVNPFVFAATTSGIRWLWRSEDVNGAPLATSGAIYYRVAGTNTWIKVDSAAVDSAHNVVVLGLMPNTTYEWYAESCLPNTDRCCVSDVETATTEGGGGIVVDPPEEPVAGRGCVVQQSGNGNLKWEAELVPPPAGPGWVIEPNSDSGNAWYKWDDLDNFFKTQAGEQTIKYYFDILTAGNYVFKIKSINDRPANVAVDQANDVWARFPTGSDVAGQCALAGDWVKLWRPGATPGAWTWETRVELLPSQVKCTEAWQYFPVGRHCVELSGRSRNWGFDQLALCLNGNGNPETTPLSAVDECDGTAASKTLPGTSLYTPNCDLVALHYDVAPDLDDLQAIAGGCTISRCFGIDPCVVIGAYGLADNSLDNAYLDANSPKQGQAAPGYANVSRRQMAIDVATAAYGAGGFIDTGAGWTAAVNAQAAKWKSTVQAGCEVHVADGGPSDFTADVLRRLLATGCSQAQIKASVKVYQHAPAFNEGNTLAANIAYVQARATYISIGNGNNPNNGTADLEQAGTNTTNSAFAQWARNSECSAAWIAAFSRFANKVDFSDTVEYLHITGVPIGAVNNLNSFAAYFD